MKLGCSGCLGFLVLLGLASLLVWAAVTTGARVLATPDLAVAAFSPGDGARAQQKLFALARASGRAETVTLSEAEVNALLTRHLVEARGIRLVAPSAQLIGRNRFVLDSQRPLHSLLGELSMGLIADTLPERWRTRPLWIHLGGRVHADRDRHQLRIEIAEFSIGRQPLPVTLVRLVLDPASLGLLRWPLPAHIDDVGIEPGRLVFRVGDR
jgi:hypothetical protein